MAKRLRIAVAGASGFVGKQLCQNLAAAHDVVAISRSAPLIPTDCDGVLHVRADLFSLIETEAALKGADVAVYLVHSMLPPNKLTQGKFSDLDVILADNFARAAETAGVKKIVYLGGIIPEEPLSAHLKSRLEVEWVLGSRSVPLITLRSGLIIGKDGSSFVIMERLVRRLPVLICPEWTTKLSRPIAAGDVITLLERVCTDEALPARSYDLSGPDNVSYLDAMRLTAEILGKNRLFVIFPFMTLGLSKFWLRLITRTPKQLVYPLVDSLRHDMLPKETDLLQRYQLAPMPMKEALVQALAPSPPPTAKLGSHAGTAVKRPPAVTSVQRLPFPQHSDIATVTRRYAAWMQRFMWPFISVEQRKDGLLAFIFKLSRCLRIVLLYLSFSEARSDETRQLFYISGGRLLAQPTGQTRGRFEFRRLPNSDELIAAVLDFRPSLPWWLYRYTQAKVHLLVMSCFKRYLAKK